MSTHRNQLRETSRLTTNILQVAEQSLVAKSNLDAEVKEKNQLLDLISQAHFETEGLGFTLREEANNDKKLEELQNAVQYFTLRMRRDLVKRTISLRKERDALHEQIALSQYCRLGIETEYSAFLSCIESGDDVYAHPSSLSKGNMPNPPKWDVETCNLLSELRKIWTSVSDQSTITKNISEGLLASQGLTVLKSTSKDLQQQVEWHKADFSENPCEYDLNDFLRFAKSMDVVQKEFPDEKSWPGITSFPTLEGRNAQSHTNPDSQSTQASLGANLNTVAGGAICNRYMSRCVGPMHFMEQALASQKKLLESWDSLKNIVDSVCDGIGEDSSMNVAGSVLLGICDALFTNMYVQITILQGVEETLIHVLSTFGDRDNLPNSA